MEAPERVVSFRPRTIVIVLAVTFLVLVTLALVYLSWRVITWILIAAFLAAALDPAVRFFQRRGVRRGFSAALVFFLAVIALVTLGAIVLPPFVDQIRKFVQAVPGIVEDLVAGRGPFAFLEDYGVVERVRRAVEERGAAGVFGLTGPVVDVAKSVVTGIVGIITIAVLTFFMLLEGPRLVDRFLELLAPDRREPWRRVGGNIYRTIGGYVSGNLLISLIAGVTSTVVLLLVGSEYAIALGLLVAILDLIPLAGATLAAIVVSAVMFVELGWVRGLIVVVFFVVYQQVENHFLQPVIYGRTVQLSPLAVLVAVLIGAELAGVLGALAAIPIAGSLQAIGREVISSRRETIGAS